MTEQDIANFFTFGVAVFGMLVCLIIGYVMGYNDGKKAKQ